MSMTSKPSLGSVPPAVTPKDGPPPSGGFYTPGFRSAKLLMAIAGFALLSFGLWQLEAPLMLLFRGTATTAEATSVIKSKIGLDDQVITDEALLRAAEEPRDRTYVFTNEFRFHTADGQAVDAELPTRAHLKPIYRLLDDDGLPTTVPIRYDPKNPKMVVFPLVIGTWFLPGMLTLMGLICTIIGVVLFHWANKPIEVPYIAPPAPKPGDSPKKDTPAKV